MKRKMNAWVIAALLAATGLHAERVLAPTPGPAAPVPEVAGEFAPGAAGETAAPTVRDGYALLDSLLVLFENLPVVKKGTEPDPKAHSGLTEVGNRLSQLSVDSKVSWEAGVIDKIFYARYQRLLTIFKLITTPVVRGDLLKDIFLRAFDDFVWNATFEHWNWEDKDGIAKMAAAMEEEFVQMMIYLDTRQRREELKQKIGQRILPPPPGAKKNPEAK
jgi:hypothetical protein